MPSKVGKRSRIRKHFKTLEHLSTVASPTARCLLESSGDDLIEAIGELCRNLLTGNIPLTQDEKTRLISHSKLIRLIARKKASSKTKRNLMVSQTGTGFFIPTLIGMVLPLIKSVLGL